MMKSNFLARSRDRHLHARDGCRNDLEAFSRGPVICAAFAGVDVAFTRTNVDLADGAKIVNRDRADRFYADAFNHDVTLEAKFDAFSDIHRFARLGSNLANLRSADGTKPNLKVRVLWPHRPSWPVGRQRTFRWHVPTDQVLDLGERDAHF